jgi:pimeloyl-ACP methyl ester carboxylesterase
MTESLIEVRGGLHHAQVVHFGGGEPLLFLHGAGGLAGLDSTLELLGRHFEVFAPLHPGYGSSTGEGHLDSVLDSALYHFDLLDALRLDKVPVLGHSMGGMIAAEMACLCAHRMTRLLLAAPIGLWLDDAPIPDFFVMSPPELMQVLWHDLNSKPAGQMAADFSNPEAGFEMIKALSVAGKFLWPLPDRDLRKRLHRIQTPTLILWGEEDRLIPIPYAEEFHRGITGSKVVTFPRAGHMFPAEIPEKFVEASVSFIRSGIPGG